ncbi:sensor histidine kinase [Mangrovibacterium sp.]|uniref:sensor histidine kinase n=1 Tax=Mangrovibacterium sp. TaxID=1961364 RepID=UPI0035675162
MNSKKLQTQYAPAERADSAILSAQNQLFFNNESFVNITNSVSQILVVINKERQIIYANKVFRELLSITDSDHYLGKRVGEAVQCIHSSQTEGGCGTTMFCSKCGAVNAILDSFNGIQSVNECRISLQNGESLDLKVSSTPYSLNGQEFSIFVITDISGEKRRQILERIFFHDVLNSAGGISGLSAVLNAIDDPEEISEIAQLIHGSADHLINEIKAQRQLSAAESGNLELHIDKHESISILQQVAGLLSKHEISNEKQISINPNSENFNLETDATLLKRVLGNMTKNALEASLPNATVKLSVFKNDKSVVFAVHNQNYIEEQTQLELFKRSFSTKGAGRGIGTYSMKLLGEKYLKGKVWFNSTQADGTTFFIELPQTS